MEFPDFSPAALHYRKRISDSGSGQLSLTVICSAAPAHTMFLSLFMAVGHKSRPQHRSTETVKPQYREKLLDPV